VDDDGRPEGLEAWMDLSEATAVMRAAVNRALQQGAGLSLAENLALCQVAMAPDGRLRMVEIADLLSIGKSAVTKTIDRLEERGWVVRHRDSDDRRSVQAALTPAGAEMFRRAQPVFADAVLGHLCGPLTSAEVSQLRRLLGKLLHPDTAKDPTSSAGVDRPRSPRTRRDAAQQQLVP
jgi:DNA-binding MarR family transcriptional regulator